MDQESFRRLLQTPRPSNGSTPASSRGSLLASTSSKPKTVDASQPAFKPRKVKKQSDSKYRDRAAERRVGAGNDFAEAEAVLQDFEQRVAQSEDKDAVEEQRRYLGGDKDHTILVKGLDVALLEQNKARAAASTEDDDSLERAFLEASSEPTVPKKRTREELLQVLKEKRQKREAEENSGTTANNQTAEGEVRVLEEAKKAGKFRPIGFKPVGASSDEKTKKVGKDKGKDRGKKKKKRRVEGEGDNKGGVTEDKPVGRDQGESAPQPTPMQPMPINPSVASSSSILPLDPAPKQIDEDFDIFAGAGEYEGIDVGDEEDDDAKEERRDGSPMSDERTPASPLTGGRWFATDESEAGPALPRSTEPENKQAATKSNSPPPGPPADDEEGEETEQPTRLVPLASSALPSIRDFLAMDEAAGTQGKHKKRKDKRKGGKGDEDGEGKKLSAEMKADRDYKKLKSYTDKKAAASGSK